MTAPDLDPRRKRLLFQSRRMGMHENDIMVGHFVQAHVANLSEEQLSQLEALLAVNDVDIFRWITRRAVTPAEYETALMGMIRTFNNIN